ncbi:Hypothetical protein SCF082_LOCUS32867, partial [Durusdinium trenchii]
GERRWEEWRLAAKMTCRATLFQADFQHLCDSDLRWESEEERAMLWRDTDVLDGATQRVTPDDFKLAAFVLSDRNELSLKATQHPPQQTPPRLEVAVRGCESGSESDTQSIATRAANSKNNGKLTLDETCELFMFMAANLVANGSGMRDFEHLFMKAKEEGMSFGEKFKSHRLMKGKIDSLTQERRDKIYRKLFKKLEQIPLTTTGDASDAFTKRFTAAANLGNIQVQDSDLQLIAKHFEELTRSQTKGHSTGKKAKFRKILWWETPQRDAMLRVLATLHEHHNGDTIQMFKTHFVDFLTLADVETALAASSCACETCAHSSITDFEGIKIKVTPGVPFERVEEFYLNWTKSRAFLSAQMLMNHQGFGDTSKSLKKCKEDIRQLSTWSESSI